MCGVRKRQIDRWVNRSREGEGKRERETERYIIYMKKITKPLYESIKYQVLHIINALVF